MLPTIGFIHTYGLMLLIGFLAAWKLALWRAAREGVEARHISDILVYAVVSGVLGARILYVILEWDTLDSWKEIFEIWKGGLVFYGGLAAGTATMLVVFSRRKLPLAKLADIMGPSIALGLVFGRIGCFAYGCCWGDVAEHFPLPVTFPGQFVETVDPLTHRTFIRPEGSPAFMQHVERGLIDVPSQPGPSHSLPVIPTQLMSSFDNLLICIIACLFFRRRRRYGEVFLLFGILYAAHRTFIEGLRADNPPLLFGLTISQLLSLAFGVLCLIMFVRSRMLPANVTAPEAAGRPRPRAVGS